MTCSVRRLNIPTSAKMTCLATVLTVGLSLVSGCGESIPAAAPLRQVKGKVVFKDSAALKGLKIQFLPKGTATSARPATGEINSDGTFTLKSTEGDGIPEGDYNVKLVAPGNAKGKVATSPISSGYFDEDGLSLSATIKADTTEIPPFDLKPLAKTAGSSGKANARPTD